MEINEFFNLVKARRQTVLKIVLLVLFIVLVVTFVQPLKYSASSKILLTQDSVVGADAYSISKSNQFLTNTLSQVVYSNSFFEQVLASGFNIDINQFSLNQNRKMKQWNKMVSARPISDTGMIVINVYHQDKYQADQVNQAITFVLKTKHSLYHGLANKVSIKIIDKSTLSDWPVKPNVLVNILIGLFMGVVFSFMFVYVFPNSNFRLWPKKKNKVEDIKDLKQRLTEVEDVYTRGGEDWHKVEDLIEKKQEKEFFKDIPSVLQEKDNDTLKEASIMNRRKDESVDFNGDIKNVI